MGIKIRAWDNVDLKMLYPGEEDDIHFYFDSNGIVAERYLNILVDTAEGDRLPDVSNELLEHLKYMEYAAIKDKNGNFACEGDIVEVQHLAYFKWKAVVKLGEYEQDASGGEYTGSSCYGFYAEAIDKDIKDEYDCKIISDYDVKTSLLNFDNFEIVGNIYENPELLQQP